MVCPPLLNMSPIGQLRIQYRETDWEFIKRMARHFGLSAYPEPLIGGDRAYVGVPEMGVLAKKDHMEYTTILNRRYHDLDGEASGYARDRLLTYEVESGPGSRSTGNRLRRGGCQRRDCSGDRDQRNPGDAVKPRRWREA